ncbi:MAG: hypothetical protein H6733_12250 [Alphaproteobacteria bacterium]|nr:hypothetical protein [Alphaproteobacteria bacterium]
MDLPPEVLSTTCQFCDAPLVDDAGGGATPARVVPFVVPRERALELLVAHLRAAWFAPEALRRAADPEHLQAVMVPFYAYDATARSTWTGKVGVDYQVTTGTGKNKRTETRTQWFTLSGRHAGHWDGHLVSASRGLPEADANALEPYDLGGALVYTPEHLAGLAAEHPTVDPATARSVAHAELRDEALAAIRDRFLPGNHAREVSVQTQVDLAGVELVMLPVWIARHRVGDEVLRLLVNGQTGEVVGTLPRDWAKVAMVVLAIVALLGVVVVVALVVHG